MRISTNGYKVSVDEQASIKAAKMSVDLGIEINRQLEAVIKVLLVQQHNEAVASSISNNVAN